ncbi:MAG: NBR1-Ig-like domain-containing protein [Anaerolineales bacterium]
MKRRLPFLPLIALILATLSCILQMDSPTALSPQQVDTLAAQTMAYIQWQTYSAQGTQAQLPAADTLAPPPAGAATATNTMMPSVTNTSFAPSVTPTALPCNWAQFVADVNYPDDSELGISDHFTKTWRLKNIGSCTWTSGYALVFDHGDPMGAPATQQLTTGTVAPGGTIDISVDLVTPASPGTYQGFFKLRASDSTIFGIGADANTAFWVKVQAVAGGMNVQKLEAQISIDLGATGHVSANCPAGSVVVGGGFDGGNNIGAFRSERSGNGWVVYAHRYSGANAVIKIYAYCLSGVSASSTSGYTEKTITPGGYGEAIYNCTGGSVISGGGYSVTDGVLWAYRLHMAGNGLQMNAKNTGASNGIMRSHPVCLTAAGAATSAHAILGSIGASSSGTVEADCPDGTVVTGGGFTLSTNMILTGMYRNPTENRWVVKALNQTGSNLNVFSEAICLAIS